MKKESYYCDRCGDEIDIRHETIGITNQIKINIEYVNPDKSHRHIDLCAKCRQSFKEWYIKDSN